MTAALPDETAAHDAGDRASKDAVRLSLLGIVLLVLPQVVLLAIAIASGSTGGPALLTWGALLGLGLMLALLALRLAHRARAEARLDDLPPAAEPPPDPDEPATRSSHGYRDWRTGSRPKRASRFARQALLMALFAVLVELLSTIVAIQSCERFFGS